MTKFCQMNTELWPLIGVHTAFCSIQFEQIDGFDNVLCCNKFINYSFQSQSVRMRRPVYAFVVHIPLSQIFSRHGLNRPFNNPLKIMILNNQMSLE